MTDWVEAFRKAFKSGPIIEKFRNDPVKSFLLPWLEIVEIVSAEQTSKNTGRLVVRFPVQHNYLNPGNTLHGGAQTAFFDVITSWLFRFSPDWPSAGTSRTLNTSYLRPAAEGEMLLMETELVQAGRRMGLTRGVLRREKDGAIISTCEHHKYNVDADKPKA